MFCLYYLARFVLVVLALSSTGYHVRANLLEVVEITTESSHHQVLEKWQLLDKVMRDGVEQAMKVVLPMIIRASSEVDISPACSSTIFKMMLAVRQMKGWAVSMIDASGKIPSGIFSGTSAQLGSYDQCLNITGPQDSSFGDAPLVGQYCTVEMRLPVPKRERFNRMNEIIKPLDNWTTDNFILEESRKIAQFAYFLAWRTGICVPSTCSREDMSSIVSHLAQGFGTYASVSRCEIKQAISFNGDQIGVIILFTFFGVMCLAGTLVDTVPDMLRKLRGEKEPKEPAQTLMNRIFLAFSIPRNAHRLLNTDNVVEDNIPSLHGVRFLSMTWVILGHTYLFMNLQIIQNFAFIRFWVRDFVYQTIINGLVAVDSFFFVSGFLVSYLTVKYHDTGKGVNLFIMFIRRILRLLPSTMMIIAATQLIPVLGSGPVWHEMTDFLSTKCRKNWWTNALFFNNFLHAGDMCLPHTWYSAVDMQLFIVAVIFFFLLFKNQAMGIGFNTFVVLASIIITGAVNYFKELPPTMLIANPDPLDMAELWGLTHFVPNTHMAPYGIGLALGVILARNKVMRLSPLKQVIGWCLAFAGNYGVLFSTYEWNRDTTPGVLMSTIYSAVHRSIWGFGLAWVTYCCATGYGGPVNKILSWNGWIALSRLTFLAYLWHFLVIYVHQGVLRNNIEAQHFLIVWLWFGHLVATFGLAFISYHLFDAPISQLERLLFSGGGAPRKPRETSGLNGNSNNAFEESNVDATKKPKENSNGGDFYSNNRLPVGPGREMTEMENGNNYPLHREGRRTQLPDGAVNGTFVYKM